MKADIHPQWYPNAKITCACGSQFNAGATVPELHVEICGQCHPFFTGKMKYMDTKGRVEKFREKRRRAQQQQVGTPKSTQTQTGEKPDEDEEKTFREALQKAGTVKKE